MALYGIGGTVPHVSRLSQARRSWFEAVHAAEVDSHKARVAVYGFADRIF